MVPIIIETERLILRAPSDADASAFHSALSDFDVVRMTGSVPWPYTPDDASAFIEASRQNFVSGDAFVFAITQPGGPTIGTVGLTPSGDCLELGFWLSKSHWGRGYASEAARAVIDWSQKRFPGKGLIAGHFSDNPASGRVLEKLGFQYAGEVDMPSRARDGLSASKQYVLNAPFSAALERSRCGHH